MVYKLLEYQIQSKISFYSHYCESFFFAYGVVVPMYFEGSAPKITTVVGYFCPSEIYNQPLDNWTHLYPNCTESPYLENSIWVSLLHPFSVISAIGYDGNDESAKCTGTRTAYNLDGDVIRTTGWL